MGLDVSHDCWSGPYSSFQRWRESLNRCVMRERGETDPACKALADMGATREALIAAWDGDFYADQSVPINVLMNHSDCDGSIPSEVCGPLADALQAIADKYMPPRGIYDQDRPATERFIAGLRRAAEAGEPVWFS